MAMVAAAPPALVACCSKSPSSIIAAATATACKLPPRRPPLAMPLATLLASSASASASAVSSPSPDLDLAPVFDFVLANPLAVIAGVAAIGLPILVSSLFSQPKSWGSTSAKDAFIKLEDTENNVQLLDIRSSDDVKTEGTPDLRSLQKRVLQIPYAGDEESYLKKLLSKVKDPANTTLYILDLYDGNSASLAKFLAANEFKSAYAIKDGAEGPNGWRKNELPWLLPRKGFSLDASVLKDVIDSTFGENPNLVPATLGVAAAAGVSLVVFSEAETALQLLGSAALIQLFVKKFLFATDRQKTLKELQSFLDTKIAPKELVDEIKEIGGVLLPKYKEVPFVDSTNGAVNSDIGLQVEDATGGAVTAEQVEERQSPVMAEKEVIDASSSSSLSTDIPQCPTPLSPYTQFPDLKPPSSPTASRI